MGLKGRYGRLSVLAEGDGGPYCSLHKDQQWFQLRIGQDSIGTCDC